jgi:hypothetical protein
MCGFFATFCKLQLSYGLVSVLWMLYGLFFFFFFLQETKFEVLV